MINSFSRFLYIMAEKKRSLLFLAILFLFVSLIEAVGIGLVGPFIALATNRSLIYRTPQLSWIYTQLGFQSELQFVTLLGLGIVGILYFKSFLGFSIQKYIFEFGFGLQSDLRAELLQAYLRVPYVFYLNRNTAISIQTIVTETLKFANGVLMPALFTVSNFTVVFALTLLLLHTDFISTTIVLIVILIVTAGLYKSKDKLSRWGKEGHEAEIEIIRIVNHGLGGFKETRIIGCESYFENQIIEQANKYKVSVAAATAFSVLPRYILEPLLITFLVGFTIAALFTNQSPESLTGTLGVFGMASVRLLPAASNVIQSFGDIKKNTYVIDRLYLDLKELKNTESLNLSPKAYQKDLSGSEYALNKALSFSNQVVLDRVTYHYPEVPEPALKNVSLAINKGESIGLIGKSGAGKTTLVDVILGLLIPDSGDIKVDGISVGSDLRAWQNLIGYIPQSIFLIDDTMERNIAFGVPDDKIDQQKLENAIQAAQLTDLVSQMHDGIKTIVGERGVRLSGGQRQRVGIARALYHECEILVLDEATAALDNETESLVNEAIKNLTGQKTLIIIAHRLSTIEHCDRIYLLDQGQIVKSGTYQDVILQPQVFH